MTSPTPRFRLRTESDVLAAIPYLIGFTPADSLVWLAVAEGKAVFVARLDLPPAGPVPADAREAAEHMARHVHTNATSVGLVGYGTPDRVTGLMDAALTSLTAVGVPISYALRLSGDRYFCHLCPHCLPTGGAVFDPDTSTAPATAVLHGMVALPDRDTLVRQIAPVQGRERRRMDRATQRALTRLLVSVPTADLGGGPLSGRTVGARFSPVVARLGAAAMAQAFTCYRGGLVLSDGQAAWTTVLLAVRAVRDYAWAHTDAGDGHARLWADLTRRAQPDFAAAPASLLAYSALLRGDGALANIALQRALDADPSYRMALLLVEATGSGMPPQVLREAIALSVADLPPEFGDLPGPQI